MSVGKTLGDRPMTPSEHNRRSLAKRQGKPIPPPPKFHGTPQMPEDWKLSKADKSRERMRQYWKKKREAKGLPAVTGEQLVGLAAAGMTQKQIGATLHLTQQSVSDMIKRVPDAKETIRQFREQNRLLKLAHLSRATPLLLSRLSHEIGTPDPADPDKWVGGSAKDVDALMRAVQAGERTEGLAAGEVHRVEMSGQVNVPVKETLAVLIQQVLGPKAE